MKLHQFSLFMPLWQSICKQYGPGRALYHSRKDSLKKSYKRDTWNQAKMMEGKFKKKVRYEAHVDKYKKKQTVMPVSNLARLIVLSNGAHGLGRSVILRTAMDRYLFNCGEACQKVIQECVSNLGPVDNIFFTHNTWNNVGGLMGFLMSNTNTIHHVNSILLHGPPKVDKILDMTKMFSENHIGQLAKVEWQGIDSVKFEDDQIMVEYVELVPGDITTGSPAREKVPGDITTGSPPRQKVHADITTGSPAREKVPGDITTGSPARKKVPGDITTGSPAREEAGTSSSGEETDFYIKAEDKVSGRKTVMAYIVKLKPTPRRVDTSKLVALNVKSGPWVKELIDGKTVTLADGRVVKPEDILLEEEKDTGPIVVVDCPSMDYLDSLVGSQQFLDLCAKGSTRPHLMVHMSPLDVVKDTRYQNFIDRYNPDTVHLMLNEKCLGPYIHKSQQVQSSLHHLHPEVFPILYTQEHYNTKPEPQTGNIVQGNYGLGYQVRPPSKQGFVWDELLYFDREASYREVKEKAEQAAVSVVNKLEDKADIDKWMNFKQSHIDEEIMRLRCKITMEEEQDVSEEYPEIVFLGTGSAQPSLSRNASCILVQMRKDEYLILDCGEGTLVQLLQMYGAEKTEHILSNLKAVFISHLHYDHHGGLFGILEFRSKAISKLGRSDRLTVLAPIQLKKWLVLYSRCVSEISTTIQFIPHHTLYEAARNNTDSTQMRIIKQLLNAAEYVPMPVVHTVHSYGISLKHRDGWKLVYSGDTMPSQDLVRYGKNCDILIHEATFEDESIEDAVLKKHSTTSQAVEIGKKMEAKYIMLTHFSQKFPKIPAFTDKFTEDVGYAFDFMQMRPSQWKLMHLFIPALELMYGANLKGRLLVTNKKKRLYSAQSEAYLEKAVHERKLCDQEYVEKKRRDMELWANKSHDIKSKLKISELEMTGEQNKNAEDKSNNCNQTSAKRKTVEKESLVKKLRTNVESDPDVTLSDKTNVCTTDDSEHSSNSVTAESGSTGAVKSSFLLSEEVDSDSEAVSARTSKGKL